MTIKKGLVMTRRVVAFEGKPSIDGRLLLPMALTVDSISIPVTKRPKPDIAYALDDVIGKATDFERDEETGAISFDIITKTKLSDELNAHMLCTGLVCHAENDILIIESARIRQIYFSDATQGALRELIEGSEKKE